MISESELICSNLGNKPIFVKHANLERVDDSTLCPACKVGILLVRRDPVTYELCQEDCVLCCQKVIYTDIGEQKIVEPKKPFRKIKI